MIKKMFLAFSMMVLAACSMNAQRMQVAELDFVRTNYTLTFEHLQMPARAGNPDAQYALGYLYYYGQGVVEDKKQAQYWFQLAANKGHPEAQRALSMIAGQTKIVESYRPHI